MQQQAKYNWLWIVLQRAFLRREQSRQGPRANRSADLRTGEDAHVYGLRKRFHPGRSSTIRKLQRFDRIKLGLRPLRYETLTKRERKVALREAARAH